MEEDEETPVSKTAGKETPASKTAGKRGGMRERRKESKPKVTFDERKVASKQEDEPKPVTVDVDERKVASQRRVHSKRSSSSKLQQSDPRATPNSIAAPESPSGGYHGSPLEHPELKKVLQ